MQVQPVLTSKDYKNIYSAIDKLIHQPVMRFEYDEQYTLLSQLETADKRILKIKAIITGFGSNYINPDCTFEELAKYNGNRNGTAAESGNAIYHALVKRESIGTQVIDQMGIVLLHSRTSGIN